MSKTRIIIRGQVPAKKNNRKPFIRDNRIMNFPNRSYTQWEQDALWQLKLHSIAPKLLVYPIRIAMTFYVKDNRNRDMDNMLASVMDVLQKAEIIADDSWQVCPDITLKCEGVDKANPRVDIEIS